MIAYFGEEGVNRGEERCGQRFSPGEPMPAFAFVGFFEFESAFEAVDEDEEGDVMLIIDDVVDPRTELEREGGKAGLFEEFAARALFDCLFVLKMAAGKGPFARAMSIFSLTEKDLAFMKEDDTDTDTRLHRLPRGKGEDFMARIGDE